MLPGQAIQHPATRGLRTLKGTQHPAVETDEEEVSMHDEAIWKGVSVKIASDRWLGQWAVAAVDAKTRGQGREVVVHSGPQDGQLKAAVNDHRINEPFACRISGQALLRRGGNYCSHNPPLRNSLDLGDTLQGRTVE